MPEEIKTKQNDSEEGGFFSRWSRLKKDNGEQTAGRKMAGFEAAENEPDGEIPNTLLSDNKQIETTQKEAEVETPPILTDADMPDIETLTADSDYSGFLSPGVSEELRKLALRKLFNSDFFQIRDGLDDYDEEFTHFEKLGDIITADMRFQMEQEAKAKLQQGLEVEVDNSTAENLGSDDIDMEDHDEDLFEDEIAEDDEELFEEPEAVLAARDEKLQTEAAEIMLQSDVDKKSKSESKV